MLTGYLAQVLSQLGNLGVDIETIYGMDAEGQNLLGIRLHLAGRGAENGYIHIMEFAHLLHYGIALEFLRAIFRSSTAYNACHFKIRGGLQSLQNVVSDVAIPHDGCSNLLCHFLLFLVV